MKLRLFLLFICCSFLAIGINAQGGTWVWMNGSNSAINDTAVFGTKGVPSSDNTPAGLYEAANWIDQQGNFWIFGGVDINGGLNSDLWKYDPYANTWTWVNGPGV